MKHFLSNENMVAFRKWCAENNYYPDQKNYLLWERWLKTLPASLPETSRWQRFKHWLSTDF
jgi:hypothetical protein